MFEFFVGFRFLKPKRKQVLVSVITLISVMGVAVGVATLIIVISVITGLQEDLRTKILGAYSHILVLSFNPTISDYDNVMDSVRNIEGVEGVSPFVYSEVMLTSNAGVSGAVLRGVDPDTVGDVTSLADSMVKGSLADLAKNLDAPEGAPEDPTRLPSILLGVHLASSLRLFVGETVDVVSPLGESTPMGMVPRIKKYRVVGIFDSGMYEFDAKFAFIHLRAAQEFFRIGDAASGIEVKVRDVMQAKQISGLIQGALGYPYRTKDWMEMNKNLLSALKLEKVAMFVILTLIVFVASLNIFSVLYMAVKDKQRSIAVLKSMGAGQRNILGIFLVQGMTIGVLGSLLGLVIGFSACMLQIEYGLVKLDPRVYNLDRLPMKMLPADFLLITLAAMALCFVATLIPSRIAARTDAVEVLRYE